MIFLGAGASKPFGIPTLEEFSKEVMDRLESLGHNQVIQRIENSLNEFNITLDFEALYSILGGLVNPQQSVKHAGALTAYLIESKKNLPKSYDYNEVLEDLRRIIYDKCSIGSDEFRKAKYCYDKLFEVTKENTSSEAINGKPQTAVNIGQI